MRSISWVAVLIVGCSFDAAGHGDPTGTGSSSMGSTTEPVTTSTSSSTTSGTTSSDASTSSDSTTAGSSTGETTLMRSCAEVLADDPAAPSGTYTLHDVRDSPFDGYCLMDVAEGGWLLVGRSVPGGGGVPFGWGEATGMIDDTNEPYSLDVWDKGVEFSRILIGNRGMGQYTPQTRGYVLQVPAGFPEDYADDQTPVVSVGSVVGICNPDGGPSMLQHVGYTARDDSFFIRDNMDNGDFGLRANGFSLAYDDCENGGDLNGDPGVLFVR